MKKSKQVIVIRKDLNMRKGKMVSQGAHASIKVILDVMSNVKFTPTFMDAKLLSLPHHSALFDWVNGLFTKITVSVDSEQELEDVYNKAKEAGILCAMIIDSGLTEFNGVPTKTAVAIGPAWSDEIDPITGHLKLL